MMVHVGMNVPDKEALFAEVHRVLKPSGVFALYEQMSAGVGEPDFPLPWADDGRSSFLETLEDYRRHVEAAGFEIREVDDRTESILGPRPDAALSTVDVFGPQFAERARNHGAATRAGLLRSVLVLSSR